MKGVFKDLEKNMLIYFKIVITFHNIKAYLGV